LLLNLPLLALVLLELLLNLPLLALVLLAQPIGPSAVISSTRLLRLPLSVLFSHALLLKDSLPFEALRGGRVASDSGSRAPFHGEPRKWVEGALRLRRIGGSRSPIRRPGD
jgi:hypothetical protein